MWVFRPAPHISGFVSQTPSGGGKTDSRPVSRGTVSGLFADLSCHTGVHPARPCRSKGEVELVQQAQAAVLLVCACDPSVGDVAEAEAVVEISKRHGATAATPMGNAGTTRRGPHVCV